MMNLLFICLLSLFTVSQPQSQTTSLTINIQGLESSEGKVLILLFNNSSGFPEDDQKAYKALELPITNKNASKLLEEIPAGTYAISVLHDEDLDGKMKKNRLGFPAESFGFSNDPSILFGAPSFKKSSFEVKPGKENKITIKLK